MKKAMTMILVLMTALSLCACGAKQSADAPKDRPVPENQQAEVLGEIPQETNQPDAPTVPNLDMFVGKWNIVEADFLDEITMFDIKADGTMEMNGETLTWTAEKASPNSSYEMLLTVQYPADPSYPNSLPVKAFDLRLTRTPENTFVAEMRQTQMSTSGDQYYREADYQVVEITDANAMQYLEQVPEFYTFEAKNGNEYRVVRNGEIKLKDHVGALSYCVGNLIFEKSYVEVRLTDAADDFTEGNVVNTYVDEQGVFDTIRIDSSRQYTYTVSWFGTPGSPDLQRVGLMECCRLVSTQDISGYVFLPV